MPRRCSVISCTSAKENPSITMFKVQPSNLDSWKEVIDRINGEEKRKVTFVCSEHFTDDDLITNYSSVPKDVEINIGKRERCGLKKGAIPSVFKFSSDKSKFNFITISSPKFTVLSKSVIDQLKKHRSTTTTTPILQFDVERAQNKDAISSISSTRKINDTFDLPKCLEHNKPIEPNDEQACTTPTLQEQLEVFKGLLVSIGWMFYSDGDTISMYQPIKKELHGNMRLYIEKQIVFQSNTLDIAYYIKQNQIESEILGLKKLTYPLDADQVIETLLIFNSKTICQGGPLMNDFPGIRVKTTHLDDDGRIWYHDQCSIVTESKKRCNKCSFMIRYFRKCKKKKLLSKTKKKGKSTRISLPKRVKPSTNLKSPIQEIVEEELVEEEIVEEIIYL